MHQGLDDCLTLPSMYLCLHSYLDGKLNNADTLLHAVREGQLKLFQAGGLLRFRQVPPFTYAKPPGLISGAYAALASFPCGPCGMPSWFSMNLAGGTNPEQS